MAMIRWNPFDISSMLQDDWEVPTIPGISRLVGQGLNIYETDNAIVAEAALPGVPEDNIDVTIDDGVVRVSGRQEEKQQEKGKTRSYLSTLSSVYNYSFRLPEIVSEDKEPQCELHDGILSMTFPKQEQKPPKKIQVKRANGKKAMMEK